jgi:hypothetical protein
MVSDFQERLEFIQALSTDSKRLRLLYQRETHSIHASLYFLYW